MTEKRWKGQERRVAKKLGAKRLPHTGGKSPDAESEWLVIENKDRRSLPQWLLGAVALVKIKAPPTKLPLVTLTTRQSPQILVVMDIRDFQEWFGK